MTTLTRICVQCKQPYDKGRGTGGAKFCSQDCYKASRWRTPPTFEEVLNECLAALDAARAGQR